MREFTSFANRDEAAKALLVKLLNSRDDVDSYRGAMRQLGEHLAQSILEKMDLERLRDICVVCTVEDADFLARGLIEALEQTIRKETVHLTCMWNARIKIADVSLSPVLRTYEEPFDKRDATFIIVKSIISGACVVKTNLTRAITKVSPRRVFVASPVMLAGAEDRLSKEFPDAIAERFEYVHFATDNELSADQKEVVPGIGGSVYELLGLGSQDEKNEYMPEIVKRRRSRAFV